MIQIIPNIHPIFVHFTVALFSASVGFYGLAYILSLIKSNPVANRYSQEFATVSRWCLWAVALITLMTVWAGLSASTSVRHDEPSHLAMLNHRSWALPTAASIILLALWSVWRHSRLKTTSLLFLIALLLGQGLVLSTAWRGAELVFRYGLGVISLPKTDSHNHTAAMNMPDNEVMPVTGSSSQKMLMPPAEEEEGHHHEG